MRNRKDTRWSAEEDFQPYEDNRRLFRPLNRLIVARVMRQYVPLGQEILEAGSGLGEFYDLLPEEYKLHILQIERWKSTVNMNKRTHPGARVAVADAINLPFSNGKFFAVVGYSAFDTFLEPEAAFGECYRLTKNGGLIIGFQDLMPDPDAAMLWLKRQGKVPFLTVDRNYDPFLVTFDENEFRKFAMEQPDEQAKLLRRHI